MYIPMSGLRIWPGQYFNIAKKTNPSEYTSMGRSYRKSGSGCNGISGALQPAVPTFIEASLNGDELPGSNRDRPKSESLA